MGISNLGVFTQILCSFNKTSSYKIVHSKCLADCLQTKLCTVVRHSCPSALYENQPDSSLSLGIRSDYLKFFDNFATHNNK